MIKRLLPLHSLRSKMWGTLLLAFLCAVCMFFAVRAGGYYVVQEHYMSYTKTAQRKADIYNRFSRYVTENQINGSDQQAVAHWSAENGYVTILIFKGAHLSMRAHDGNVVPSSNMQDYERLQYASQYGKLYPTRFADGVYQIAISENSQEREYLVCNILALLASGIVLMLSMLGYVRRLTGRIIQLSKETAEVSAGALDDPIELEGSDELSRLASDMDTMRRSVIERMSNESRAWKANSELITAISHDIRTPMTAMIGYLGLLDSAEEPDEERRRQFTSAAYGKAMELKDLTDELFKYFLVFGKAELEMELESFDARLLLEQLLGESVFDLNEAGFNVSTTEFEGECSITVDPMYLKRIVDNMVSNIKKYADKAMPVMFISEYAGGKLSLCASNNVAKPMDRVESTKIGLRTCTKIAEHMGGSFLTHSDGKHFCAELILPAQPISD